jgi:hypothetical protein
VAAEGASSRSCFVQQIIFTNIFEAQLNVPL